jgi:alpha-glucosidase (family GH31 glycosyl hydrolase)
MPYWCSDIGGWQSVEWIADRPQPSKKLLIKSDIFPKSTITAPDFPELYVRWFQFGAFSPVFRAHGTREDNEVWSYGPDVEKILVKYLRLRYRLLPYIYSQAYKTNQTGAPFMRALFMDFPDDKNVADITDEYMFGPSLLVAPVVEQGQDIRSVYLPEGNEWYDFWTNKKYAGGQTITIAAPIDRIPIFVKSGTVLTLGPVINYIGEKPEDLEVRIYKGASGSCDIYQDENDNYNYEKGLYTKFTMSWNNSNSTLLINNQAGDFPGASKSKTINFILIEENKLSNEKPADKPDKTIEYSGKEISLKF